MSKHRKRSEEHDAEAASKNKAMTLGEQGVPKEAKYQVTPEALNHMFSEQARMLELLLRANVAQYEQHAATQAERRDACRFRLFKLQGDVQGLQAQRRSSEAKQTELALLVSSQNEYLSTLEADYGKLEGTLTILAGLLATVGDLQSRMDSLKTVILRLPHQTEQTKKAEEEHMSLSEKMKILTAMQAPIDELNAKITAQRASLVKQAEALREGIKTRLPKFMLTSVESDLARKNKYFTDGLSQARSENAERCRNLGAKLDKVVAVLQALEARRIASNHALVQVYGNHTHGQSDVLHIGSDCLAARDAQWARVIRANSTGAPTAALTFRH